MEDNCESAPMVEEKFNPSETEYLGEGHPLPLHHKTPPVAVLIVA